MNDRYLFRAKHSLESKKWNIGNLVEEPDGLYLRDNKNNIMVYIQDHSTICQCTGLKDKNGKKIFENDVVYMRCNGLSGYGNVIYENGCFWVDDKKRGRKYPFSNHDVKYRVDGNIFDNPELMHE